MVEGIESVLTTFDKYAELGGLMDRAKFESLKMVELPTEDYEKLIKGALEKLNKFGIVGITNAELYLRICEVNPNRPQIFQRMDIYLVQGINKPFDEIQKRTGYSSLST